VIEFIVF